MISKKTPKGKRLDLSYKPNAPIFSRGLTIASGPAGNPNRTFSEEKRRNQGSLPHQYPWVDEDDRVEDEGSSESIEKEEGS